MEIVLSSGLSACLSETVVPNVVHGLHKIDLVSAHCLEDLVVVSLLGIPIMIDGDVGQQSRDDVNHVDQVILLFLQFYVLPFQFGLYLLLASCGEERLHCSITHCYIFNFSLVVSDLGLDVLLLVFQLGSGLNGCHESLCQTISTSPSLSSYLTKS